MLVIQVQKGSIKDKIVLQATEDETAIADDGEPFTLKKGHMMYIKAFNPHLLWLGRRIPLQTLIEETQ
jgi:hypothetical protein